METALFNNAYANSARGEFDSAEHRRLSEMVTDYKPTMRVIAIPPNTEAGITFAYAIVDAPAGMEPYITRYLTREMLDSPASILEWLFNGDLIKHRPKDIFARIQTKEAAEQAVKMKEQMDRDADINDLGAFFFSGGRDKLHTIKLNGKKFERG